MVSKELSTALVAQWLGDSLDGTLARAPTTSTTSRMRSPPRSSASVSGCPVLLAVVALAPPVTVAGFSCSTSRVWS